jgi:photosystem II stability/assembly factor-like uncharacterized protein
MRTLHRLAATLLLALISNCCLNAQSRSLTVVRRVDDAVGIVMIDKALMRTTDNGKSWADITPRLAASETVAAAYFLDKDTGWSVISASSQRGEWKSVRVVSTGTSGGFLDGQSSLVPVSPEFLGFWSGAAYLTFVDANHGWLELQRMSSSNFKAGLIWKTQDGGRSWTELPIPPTVDQIKFISSNVGWIAGGPGGGNLYRTANGGQSWTDDRVPQATEATQAFYSVPQVDASGRVFLAVTFVQSTAETDSATLAIYASNDEGVTWVSYSVQDRIATSGLIPTDVAGKTIVAVLGEGERIASSLDASKDDAMRVSRIRAPAEGGVLNVYFVDSLNGWLVLAHDFCVQKTHCESHTRLLATSDGGLSTHDITPRYENKAWAAQSVPENESLRRGMDLIEGFYHSISATPGSLP